ncbi:MAG: glutathione synthase [Gammaproteobacteria bacterium]
MDPIDVIKPVKDSSFAMLLAAQRAGYALRYMHVEDMRIDRGIAMARSRALEVRDNLTDWFTLSEAEDAPLSELDVILMRKDPPFDMEYIYATYILERAEAEGVLVVNKPSSLRDVNEKVYMAWFAQFCPDTLITRSMDDMRAFHDSAGKMVVKPLDGMGGASIFVVNENDGNRNVIFETLTDYGRRFAMAQQYLPEIKDGDKRILIVDGEPVPYCLARIPGAGDARGNLAAGGTGRPQPLSDRDREICAVVGPAMREKGLLFVGLDVIGDYITEINVTSPTGIRELDSGFDLDIAGLLMQAIDKRLNA